MAFNKGGEAIEHAATRSGGGKFVPDFRWEDKETKYLQFLDPLEEWVTVLMHPFVWVPADNEEGKRPEKFISRRDSALDGESGYDLLVTRWQQNPVYRTVALAVQLEKKPGNKFVVATRQYEARDGTVKEVPAVGLVMQSPHTFSKHAKAQVDEGFEIEDYVWAVKRQGSSTDTTYSFSRMVEAVELPDEVQEFLDEYDFDGYLEDLASEQRMRDMLGELGADWVVNQFAKKKQGGKGNKPSSSRSRKQVDPEPEESGDGEEQAESRPSRQRRFAALRDSVAS